MRILFVTATRVGDAVLSTGLLSHLIERYPAARLTIACGHAAAPLFLETPNVERIVELVKRRAGLHWLTLWRIAARQRWHLVVDLRASLLSYFLLARQRRILRPDERPIHRVEALGELAGPGAPPAPRLFTGPRQQAEAERLLPKGRPLLAIGPTAGWRGKEWRAERFAELARRLTAPNGILPAASIVVLGAAVERADAQPVIDALPPERCVDLVGEIDLLTAHAVLERCRFFVGNDSGLMHIAAAAGVPTLGLFGPSRETHYGPWGEHCAVVRTALSYEELIGASGYDHRTTDTLMDSLTVDMAEAAARRLWERSSGAAA